MSMKSQYAFGDPIDFVAQKGWGPSLATWAKAFFQRAYMVRHYALGRKMAQILSFIADFLGEDIKSSHVRDERRHSALHRRNSQTPREWMCLCRFADIGVDLKPRLWKRTTESVAKNYLDALQMSAMWPYHQKKEHVCLCCVACSWIIHTFPSNLQRQSCM
jgi:hypothetical protein